MGVRPVPHKVTQPFGANPTAGNPHPVYGDYQSAGHSGIDLGCPIGTPVVAPEDMTITFADWGSKFPTEGDMTHAGLAARYYLIGSNVGIGVIGETGHGAYALYHLDRTDLNAGDKVKAGDLIGYSGNTGQSTGPHLHVDWIPAPANYGTPLYGRADPMPRFTEPYRINGHQTQTVVVKTQAVVTPTPKPKPVGELDGKTMTDPIGGRVASLRDIFAFRILALYRELDRVKTRLDALEKENSNGS